MIIVFDLDDTLYEEATFAISGFRAVVREFKEPDIWDNESSEKFLLNLVRLRDKAFNLWLNEMEIFSEINLRTCINIFRHHIPSIDPYPEIIDFLLKNPFKNYYIVTDGDTGVQRAKYNALGIQEIIRNFYPTSYYGLEYAKPSVKIFNHIRKIENIKWDELLYIGDDPRKDFLNLKKVGALTIRIKQGRFKHIELDEEFEAKYCVNSAKELVALMKGILRNEYC